MVKRKIVARLLKKKTVDHVKGGLLYKLGTQMLIDRKFPLHINLELTRVCNYDCLTCPRKQYPIDGFMDIELAQKIIDEAVKYGPTSFALHMFGEPLFHPKWDIVVDMTKKAHKGNTIILTTNGSLIKDNVSKLQESQIDRMFVSFHSLDPVKYRAYTGGKEIERVIKGIELLRVVNRKIKITARLFSADHKKDLEVYKRLEKAGVDFELRRYHNYAGLKDSRSDYKFVDMKRYPCYHLWFTLSVNVKGEVPICCADASGECLLGDAKTESLHSIWNGIRINSLRRMHKTGKFFSVTIPTVVCGKCDVWKFRPNFFFKGQYK